MPSRKDKTAIVLAGAVANGAFEAGALEVVAQHDLPIACVLGTSSGALNATLFARYALAGEQQSGSAALVKLWQTHATWWHVFRPDLVGMLTLTGFSSQSGILSILRKYVHPVPTPSGDVTLCVVVTSLRGVAGDIGGSPATTHEAVCWFGKEDFASAKTLPRVFEAAAASAAFPGAFVPAKVSTLGRCADGGIVNNTPLKHVLTGDIGRVIVIVPSPRLSHEHAPDNIGALVGRVADIIVQERLYRDLREAEQVNERLAKLDELLPKLGKTALGEVKCATGLDGARRVEIVEIRPRKVPPNSFAGFFSRSVRDDLIEEGRAAARKALSQRGSVTPSVRSA